MTSRIFELKDGQVKCVHLMTLAFLGYGVNKHDSVRSGVERVGVIQYYRNSPTL